MATVKPDRDCTRCNLHETAQTVCLMGRGSIPSDVMIVGEAPGFREDEIGKPFQGKAGQEVLDPVLAENGIRRDSIYITNTVRCRPPHNNTPRKSQIDACRKWMDKEIRIVKPKYVLCMGKTALHVCPSWSAKTKLGDVRGKAETHDGITYFATYHPAACLPGRDRRGRMLASFKLDLASFFRLVKSEGKDEGLHDLNMKIVHTVEDFNEMIEDIYLEEYVSYDLETMGLYQWNTEHDIVSAQFGLSHCQWYLPVVADHTRWWRKQPFRTHKSRKMAYRIISKALRDRKVISQGGKFDSLWGWVKYGAVIRPWVDTLPLSVVLDENAPHNLSYMSAKYFGASNYDIKVEQKQGYNISLHDHATYSCYDSMYTRMLAQKLIEELEQDGRLSEYFWTVFMPAYRNYITMQYNGVYVDNERFTASAREAIVTEGKALGELNRIRRPITKDMPRSMAKKLRAEKGHRRGVNWNSPKQLAELLYDELGFPIIERNKPSKTNPEGSAKTDESVLKRLAKLKKKKSDRLLIEETVNDKDHNVKVLGPPGRKIVWFKGHIQDVPQLIIDYRKAKKLREFVDSWTKFQDSKHFMHPNFKIEVVTGRGSCEDPNIQQTPRNQVIRSCISAPSGWEHVSADYSQIELRIAAIMSNDPTMKKVFQTGGDIHLETARRVSGKREISSEERKRAKAVNFGFIYGMGWVKFQGYARDKYGVVFSDSESQEVRTEFFSTYNRLPRWHDRQRRIVHSQGYVRTMMGRKRNLPTIYSTDEMQAREAERQAINSPVQGTGSELKYAAMNDISDSHKRKDLQLSSEIHDELNMRIRKTYFSHRLLEDIKGMMEEPSAVRKLGVHFTVPIIVEIKIGPWGSGEVWQPTT